MKNYAKALAGKKVHLLLIVVFLALYLSIFKSIPLSFWDEICWVGKSYHFDLFIKGDFANPLWEHPNSFDQPKLGELFFGAALYPQYLIAKADKGSDNDYIKFLIDKNIYYFVIGEEQSSKVYEEYLASRTNYTPLNKGDWGYQNELLEQYGPEILRTINLIYSARIANAILASFTVIVVYSFGLLFLNKFQATVVAALFGLNHFFIETALMAHAEALFYLLFISGLYLLTKIIIKKEPGIKDIIIFSLASGLASSTKLNGSMLLIIFNLYFVYRAIRFFLKSKRVNLNTVKILLIGNIIAFMAFFLTNPFLFKDPIRRSLFLFSYREEKVLIQQEAFKEDALLTFPSRMVSIFDKFLLYKEEFKYPYSKPTFINTSLIFIALNSLIILVGFIKLTLIPTKIARVFIFLFLAVLTSMGFYLLLAWQRYYAPLLVFFVTFQGVGLYHVFGFSKKFLTKISH